MTDFVPEAFAREWVAAWNRADAEAVLSHFAEDVTFVSPLAATVVGNAEVRGKPQLRAYWTAALKLRPSPPQFEFDSVVWDPPGRALLIVYRASEASRTVRKCELMIFNPEGLIVRGEAFTGATAGN